MEIDLEKIEKIYFIGIGGIAMSATAGIAREAGFTVLGSDAKTVYAPSKDVLDSYHIEYFIGYDPQHIIDNPADLYILSAGEDLSNPEVAYITEKELPYISFPELLYELSKDNLRVVVTGTHGKSTTSGFLGTALKTIDNSSYMVGAVLQHGDTNFYRGDGHYFVFEGDEYKSTFDDPTPKFQYYHPDIVILTNVEFDHPDVYENIEQIIDEFRELIASMPSDGLLIYNADDVNASKLAYEADIASFGFSLSEPSDFQASDIVYTKEGTRFTVRDTKHPDHEKAESYEITLPGEINIYNALAVIATLRSLGFSRDLVLGPLEEYAGVKRRFEVIGEKNGIIVVDDYAHHPTAVRETLHAAKTKYPDSRVWAIFEPHTFSRTVSTLPELVDSFETADKVLLAEIYPARENIKTATINGRQVVEAISKNHKDVRYVADKQSALDILKAEVKSGDVVIVMAVGSFNKLAYDLFDSL